MEDKEKKSRMKLLIQELVDIPKEEREILAELDSISPDPSYLNYIFYSEEFVDDNGVLDVDLYIEKVFGYKPIAL